MVYNEYAEDVTTEEHVSFDTERKVELASGKKNTYMKHIKQCEIGKKGRERNEKAKKCEKDGIRKQVGQAHTHITPML